jgi:O-antigen/teichoic acid export membrane protein
MNDSMAETVSRNVVTTILVRAFYMVTRFIIPPFVLSYIGLEQYGLITALFVVVGYIGMSVVGFSGAYVKFTAEFYAAGDYDSINELLSTGLAITIPLYALAFAAIFAGWTSIYAATGLPAAMEPQARAAGLLVIGSFLAGVALWGFADLLNGAQMIHTMQKVLLVTYAIETSLIFLLVGTGHGVLGLAEAFVARSTLSVAVAAWICFHSFEWLRISPRMISRRSMRLLLGFGGVVQVQSTLSIVLSTIERALAVPLLGSAAAAVYDLAKKLPSAISDLTGSFFSAMMPAASASGSIEDSIGVIRNLYLMGARYSAIVSSLLCAVPVCFARPLLEAWIGRRLPGMVECAVLFGVAMQVHLLTGPGTSILRGMGRLSGDFYYLLPNIVFLACGLVCVRIWQGGWTIVGIAAAVSAATALAAVVVIAFAHHVLDIGFGEYVRTVIAPCAAPYGIAILLAQPLHSLSAEAPRWHAAGLVVLAAAVHALAVLAILWMILLNASEKARVRLEIARLRSAMNGILRRRVVYETH